MRTTSSISHGPRMPRWLVALCLLSHAVVALAQAPERDAIDARFDACLGASGGQTTAGMVECTGQAISAWDQRLNQVYQQALKALDPKSRELLRAAQRQWLAFRSAEAAAQRGPWSADRGSMVRVQLMGTQLAAIRSRVEDLRVYLPESASGR